MLDPMEVSVIRQAGCSVSSWALRKKTLPVNVEYGAKKNEIPTPGVPHTALAANKKPIHQWKLGQILSKSDHSSELWRLLWLYNDGIWNAKFVKKKWCTNIWTNRMKWTKVCNCYRTAYISFECNQSMNHHCSIPRYRCRWRHHRRRYQFHHMQG